MMPVYKLIFNHIFVGEKNNKNSFLPEYYFSNPSCLYHQNESAAGLMSHDVVKNHQPVFFQNKVIKKHSPDSGIISASGTYIASFFKIAAHDLDIIYAKHEQFVKRFLN